MKTHPVSCTALRQKTILGILVCCSALAWSCGKGGSSGGGNPGMAADTYNCKNRIIKVGSSLTNGVDKQTVVLCGGKKVRWEDVDTSNPSDWEIDFSNLPFLDCTKKVKKGVDCTVLSPDDDTAYPYDVFFSKQTSQDPQIIIMGK